MHSVHTGAMRYAENATGIGHYDMGYDIES